MIKRNTWIVLLIFAVVVVFAYFFPKIKQATAKKVVATPTTSISSLFTFENTQIASLRIQDSQGKAVAVKRDEAGLWVLTEPTGDTDSDAVDSTVNQLVALQPQVNLDPVTDMSIYGLSKPVYYIYVTLNGGEKHTIIVGDVTPTKSGYYIRLDENPPQVVGKYNLDAILGMLSKPPFKPTATPQPSLTPTQTLEVTPTITPTATLLPSSTATMTALPTITATSSITATVTTTAQP